MPKNDDEVYVLTLSLEVITRYGKPTIQLRKVIKDRQKIRELVTRALEEEFIPAKILIRDKLTASIKLKALDLI